MFLLTRYSRFLLNECNELPESLRWNHGGHKPYNDRIEIHLTWHDLLKLAANGRVEKEGNTLIVDRTVLPSIEGGSVHFTLDDSDPRSKLVK
jgi:hypothetical protein